jgi:DNA-binding transcriptional MerR regulator
MTYKSILQGTSLNELSSMLLAVKPANKSMYSEMLIASKIDPNKPLMPAPICLSVVGSDGKEGIIGTLGNISLIIGKAKSKKTFCISMFLASMAKNGLIQERFRGNLPNDKKRVIFFDTEQSQYNVQNVFHRVRKLIGATPENFDAHCLRKYTPEERLRIIEEAIYTTPDLGFVVIDGIRDLVTSINDEEQATQIASYLLKWTEEKNIHIVTVLHQNKGDLNARGHLGTELVNKAETVLSVSLDQNNKSISIVEAEFCRQREPETFAFFVDELGLPEVITDWKPSPTQTGGRKRKESPDSITDKVHFDTLSDIFRDLPKPTGTQIKNCLNTEFSIGTNMSGQYLTYYEKEGWITKEGKSNSPRSFFIFVPEAFTD